MIPLMLDLADKCVMIFGGGRVGLRKAAFFSGDARIRVISRSFIPEFDEMNVECIKKDISTISGADLSSLLDNVFLAVAATPDEELNNRIGDACREAGVLFNSARGEWGDVIIPSRVRGRNYVLGISTKGSSPAVSRFIREYIEKSCPNLDEMIDLQIRLRSHLKSSQPDEEKRNEVIRTILHDKEIWKALTFGEGEAWSLIEARYL